MTADEEDADCAIRKKPIIQGNMKRERLTGSAAWSNGKSETAATPNSAPISFSQILL
jgi:hypothetical protein